MQKVYRLIGLKDLPLLLSVISISLALLCLSTVDSLDVVRIFSLYDESINFNISVYKLQQVDVAKVMFLFFALVFDLYKWCFFIASTGKNVKAD